MYSVYAIASVNKKYVYVGFSADMSARLNRHNNGYEKTTKPYAPFVIVFSESFETRIQARLKEKSLKSRSGKRFLYQLIRQNFPNLKQY